MFGKTFQKSAKELTAAGLAFAVLILAYAQLGFLVTTCRPRLGSQSGWLSARAAQRRVAPHPSPRHDCEQSSAGPPGAPVPSPCGVLLSATGQAVLARDCVCVLSLSWLICGPLLGARAL